MLAAYDRLPRIVRDIYKYTAADLRKHEAEECCRTYGPDHPQSNNYGRRLRPNQIAIWGDNHD